jgi:hypothetical protein
MLALLLIIDMIKAIREFARDKNEAHLVVRLMLLAALSFVIYTYVHKLISMAEKLPPVVY